MSQISANFLGGSPLNRLGWLRTSQPFMNAIISSPATRWVLFQSGQSLLAGKPDISSQSLARLTTLNVKPVLGSEPFIGQGQHQGGVADPGIPELVTARFVSPKMVFLGLHEPQGVASALPSSDFSGTAASPASLAERIQGTPYFAMDLSDIEQTQVDELLQTSSATQDGLQLSFVETRAAIASLDAFDAAILAEARSMVDWNERNRFCPSCGSPVYSQWAGWKLTCSSLLPWADNTGKKPCATGRGLHNFSHPRTDPVVIMLPINETGDKILLGRNRKWPQLFYSALAGFMEPGETFEDAVKREVREEAGIDVWDAQYHSTQPWPFPANLMVGFYAKANESQPIRLDLDNELADARWFTRDEILTVINHPKGFTLPQRDNKRLNALMEGQSKAEADVAAAAEVEDVDEKNNPPIRVPPLTAIAGVLISDWAHGKAGKARG